MYLIFFYFLQIAFLLNFTNGINDREEQNVQENNIEEEYQKMYNKLYKQAQQAKVKQEQQDQNHSNGLTPYQIQLDNLERQHQENYLKQQMENIQSSDMNKLKEKIPEPLNVKLQEKQLENLPGSSSGLSKISPRKITLDDFEQINIITNPHSFGDVVRQFTSMETQDATLEQWRQLMEHNKRQKTMINLRKECIDFMKVNNNSQDNSQTQSTVQQQGLIQNVITRPGHAFQQYRGQALQSPNTMTQTIGSTQQVNRLNKLLTIQNGFTNQQASINQINSHITSNQQAPQNFLNLTRQQIDKQNLTQEQENLIKRTFLKGKAVLDKQKEQLGQQQKQSSFQYPLLNTSRIPQVMNQHPLVIQPINQHPTSIQSMNPLSQTFQHHNIPQAQFITSNAFQHQNIPVAQPINPMHQQTQIIQPLTHHHQLNHHTQTYSNGQSSSTIHQPQQYHHNLIAEQQNNLYKLTQNAYLKERLEGERQAIIHKLQELNNLQNIQQNIKQQMVLQQSQMKQPSSQPQFNLQIFNRSASQASQPQLRNETINGNDSFQNQANGQQTQFFDFFNTRGNKNN